MNDRNNDYTPPKVQTWEKGNGGQFASVAGPVKGWQYRAGEILSAQVHTSKAPWADQIFARPTVPRDGKVNRTPGDPVLQLRDRLDAGNFESRTQDKLERMQL